MKKILFAIALFLCACSQNEAAILKTGTYKLKISAKIFNEYDEFTYDTPFETTITVKVVETKPGMTLKQTQKVNTLYTNQCYDSFGRIKLSPKGVWEISSAELVDQSETKKCDYDLIRCGRYEFFAVLKTGGNPKNNKGKIVIDYYSSDDLNRIYEILQNKII